MFILGALRRAGHVAHPEARRRPEPVERPRRRFVVLTGGPGGGKSTLIEDLRNNPAWSGRFVALPETAHVARFSNISSGEKLFQRAMVQLQMALENGLHAALGENDRRIVICHRGSLDPLAFWMERGWPPEEFFAFTGTTRDEHFRRYALVLHLVTAADGVPGQYTRWPQSHRPEEADEAIRLDRSLAAIWGPHPGYVRIDNGGKEWKAKSGEAEAVLTSRLGPAVCG